MNEIKITPRPFGTEILQPPTEKLPAGGKDEGFGDLLKNAIEGVNELQQEAGQAQDKFARGEAAELHQVMIAAEKAGLSFDLLLEIRQRLVEAFQQIMRMPV
jgi:flagellar hook-basal body complex protein FliE